MKRIWIILLTSLCLLLANVPAGAQNEYFIHTVRWYENIKDISKKYDVPVEVIMEVNELDKPKVKTRMKLKIPVDLQSYYRRKAESEGSVTTDSTSVANNAESASVSEEAAGREEEEAFRQEEEKKESSWNWGAIFGFRSKVKATVILPLGADAASDNYFDFYSGALLAAKDLGETGIGADVSVINLANEDLTAALSPRLESSDLIIGPVSGNDLEKVLFFAGKTPVISPLDPRAAVFADSTENFIQAPAAASRQYSDLASWLIEEREESDNVVVIAETGTALSSGMKEAEAILSESGIGFKKIDYTILEGRNITSKIEAAMVPEVVNRVVVLSEKEAFVNDVVRNLNLMQYNKFNVVLYSASKIRSFETIDIENLHSLSLHVCSSYYIDYDDPRVKRFILSYRALFNTEPSQFAFQGYDVAGYFIKACHDSGNSWPKKLSRIGNAKMLQADFKFMKLPRGGYVNTGIRRIIFDSDYSVREILR
ncbi:MAG: LysM peptidoglycan-binding domain-containing protein [Bacteroidales bacterium]|nr:LysM peptidoglycan-binding domain-containing protein [Bacteroidales bacterium]